MRPFYKRLVSTAILAFWLFGIPFFSLSTAQASDASSAATSPNSPRVISHTTLGMASPIHQDWQIYLKRYALQYAWTNDQQHLLQLSDADTQHYHSLVYGQNSWGNKHWGDPVFLPVVSTYNLAFLHFHQQQQGLQWSGVLSLSPYSRLAYADFDAQVFQSASLGLMMHKTIALYRVDALLTVGGSFFHRGLLQSDQQNDPNNKAIRFLANYQGLIQVVRDFYWLHDTLVITPGVRYQYDLMRLNGVSSQWHRVDAHVSMKAQLDRGFRAEFTTGLDRLRFRATAPTSISGYHPIEDSWQWYAQAGIEATLNDHFQCVVLLGGGYTLNGFLTSSHFGVLINYQW